MIYRVQNSHSLLLEMHRFEGSLVRSTKSGETDIEYRASSDINSIGREREEPHIIRFGGL
jgi:hypothetical protein